MIHQLINDEKFTNIQRAQAGLTHLFKEASKHMNFYRVMRNDKSLGVLLPEELWESLTEDIEALSSSNFKKRIEQARNEKRRYSSKEVKKLLNLK